MDVTVAPGELVHLAGASGAGKSSVLKAVGGLLAVAPDAHVTGRVRVAGVDPLTARAAPLARAVGQVLQVAEEGLLALDVAGEVALRLENQGVPENEGARRVHCALERWGLTALAERATATLSTGESKRVALAAALATEPSVLLLDEPFTGLDPAGRRVVRALLADAAEGRAALVAEHDAHRLHGLATRTLRVGAAPAPAHPLAPLPVPPDAPPLVSTRGLACARGGRRILQDVDLDLAPGFVAVVGLNGAGKSTLLRALLGLDAPAEGRVHLAGLDAPHAARPRDLARRVGYAGPLAADLFTTSGVRAEIALTARALGAPRVDVEALARDFRLAHVLERHPLALSGGERQRLALAAAVAHAPRVLVLDEPTVGLDATARRALLLAVARVVAEGGLVLAATHDEALIAHAHRVLEVDGGRGTLHEDADAFLDGPGRRLGYARIAPEAVA